MISIPTDRVLILKLGLLLLFPVLSACQQAEVQPKEPLETGSLEVTIRVDGVKNRGGQVIALLFRNRTGFPDSGKQAERVKSVDDIPENEPLEFTFTELPDGAYAVSVLHDENGDEQMNRSLIGVPQEGYGMTNNPPVSEGAPSFEDAVFELEGKSQTRTVQMNYLERE